MKIGITGHTRGIGSALYKKFVSQGHDVIGFSLSTGYDIRNQNHRQAILDACKDCDIFINNAYDSIGQTQLLESFINSWEKLDKIIIHFGSKIIFTPIDFPQHQEYIRTKKSQQALLQSRMLNNRPKILNVLPGLVDTSMAAKFKSPKINPTDLANLIYDVIQYKDKVTVQELIVDVCDLESWNDIIRP